MMSALVLRRFLPVFTLALLCALAVAQAGFSGSAQGAPLATGNIAVREGDNAGEVVVSWDAVPQATHYRIGYVNMEVDYLLATASCTGEWIEAFIYVDVNARNILVNSDGRAEYIIRRLSPGAAHAFTVLTSNDFVDTGGGESVSSEFFWPPKGSRWARLPGRDTLPEGITLPTGECTDTAAGQTAPPSTGNIAVREGGNAGEVVVSWDAVPQATYYRIGYVNMEVDYFLATNSCTKEWIEAFIYVDVNARNIPVSDDGRAEYTIRRLSPGAEHAFTVLTSNDFVDTGADGSVRSEFFWPPKGSRWARLPGREILPPGITLPTGECTDVVQPSPSGSVAGDRAALAALYNATDGPNWANNSNWLSDAPIGSWHGVTTDPNGRVIMLDLLGENRLTGVIPPELGGLANLRYLRLSGNQHLTGTIPLELGGLINLEELHLENNQLTGAVPPELGNLTNLEHLDLWGNRLTGAIPPELGNLTNLTSFGLWENRLTGAIPPELGGLTNLTSWRLYRNRLTGAIPPELGNLTNLTSFGLWENRLTGAIPPELGGLTNLTSFDLTSNRLTGAIPPELGNLTNLTWLRLGRNRLTGAIPPELGNLANLEQLHLWENRLTGEIPPELGSLTNLEGLQLSGNRLTGEIPPELDGLLNLKSLYLSRNQLMGCIPSDWRYVISNDLENMGMPFCDPAPTTLPSTDRAALIAFYNAMGGPGWEISFNWLSDAPLGFWYGVTVDRDSRVIKLLADMWWGASQVQLTGEIPPELGSLTNLKTLGLTGNLTGPIPPELGSLTNLEYLLLRGNLTGPIPPELGSVANLKELHLYGNRLTGSIPAELDGLADLTVLHLGRNQLMGAIPPELGALANLKELHLYGNRLTGSIPAELGNLANLEKLSLADNQLTGSIPAELGHLTNLESLNLRINRLTGSIPAELGRLTNLEYLDLYNNQLAGAIPPELGNLTNLTGLHLWGNRFTGCIPAVWRDAGIYRLSLPNLPFCD